MAVRSRHNPDGTTSYIDDSVNPPAKWTAKGNSIVDGSAPKGWKSSTTVSKETPGNWKITAWKGDKLITTDPTTGKKSSNWNATQFAKSEEDINNWAKAAGFDPGKWSGKDTNEKFQHFLHDNPEHPDWAKVIDDFHSSSKYGTPTGTGKMFDSKLGVRWLDAINQITKEKPKEEPIIPGITPPIEEQKKSPGYVPPYIGQRRDAPFWLQDEINIGAATANRLGLKKYMPWAPKVEPHVPRPTFYDPTRELASNAEQMKIGTEGAGLFSGPQAFNSRFAQISGQGAKNAANILAKYHSMNVNEANRFENIKAGIYNQADQFNANSAQRLYDQTTVANQQFDNSKRKAFDEMRGAVVNAYTNRAMAQTMNYMYPHYQIDPSSGGFTYGYKGSDILPKEQSDDFAGMAQSFENNPIIAQYYPEAIAQKYGYNSKGNRRAVDDEGDAFLNQYSSIRHREGGEANEEKKWLKRYNQFPTVFR